MSDTESDPAPEAPAMPRGAASGSTIHDAGNIRYAVIENGIVVNEIIAGEDPAGLAREGQTLVRLPDPHEVHMGYLYDAATGTFSPPNGG